MNSNKISFSIIIPVYNESSNIEILCNELNSALVDINNYEIIFVNDGSVDKTLDILNANKNKYNLSIVNNSKNYGQSYSFLTGIKHAKYDTIVTMDGDLQNNPLDILNLLNHYSSNDYSLVGGLRLSRKDNYIKIISSKIANKIRNFILKDNCLDTGCSLKIFDRKLFLSFPFFDGMHRFLPALFLGYGAKTFFIPVDHRPRISGVSKYGTLKRLFRGIIDIFKVKTIIRRKKYYG